MAANKNTLSACAALMAFCLPLAAERLHVPHLPAPAFADTEVSTNFFLPKWDDGYKHFDFTLELNADPNTNVEIALGSDGNADGMLAHEESVLIIGMDCGVWFVSCPNAGVRHEVAAVPDGNKTTLSFRSKVESDKIKRITLKADQETLVFPELEGVQKILTEMNFNMAKVVVRGVGVRDMGISFEATTGGTIFIIR